MTVTETERVNGQQIYSKRALEVQPFRKQIETVQKANAQLEKLQAAKQNNNCNSRYGGNFTQQFNRQNKYALAAMAAGAFQQRAQQPYMVHPSHQLSSPTLVPVYGDLSEKDGNLAMNQQQTVLPVGDDQGSVSSSSVKSEFNSQVRPEVVANSVTNHSNGSFESPSISAKQPSPPVDMFSSLTMSSQPHAQTKDARLFLDSYPGKTNLSDASTVTPASQYRGSNSNVPSIFSANSMGSNPLNANSNSAFLNAQLVMPSGSSLTGAHWNARRDIPNSSIWNPQADISSLSISDAPDMGLGQSKTNSFGNNFGSSVW